MQYEAEGPDLPAPLVPRKMVREVCGEPVSGEDTVDDVRSEAVIWVGTAKPLPFLAREFPRARRQVRDLRRGIAAERGGIRELAHDGWA